MKYCGKCGTQNDDAMSFCKNCGKALMAFNSSPVPPAAPGPVTMDGGGVAAPKKLDPKILGIIAVAAGIALVIALLAIFGVFGGGVKTDIAIKYLEASFDEDGETVLELMVPKDIREELLEAVEDEYNMDEDDLIENYEEYCGGDEEFISAKFEYLEDCTKDEIEVIQEYYDDLCDEIDISDIKIKDAKMVKVEVEYNDTYYDAHYVFDDSVVIVKIGGKWYVSLSEVYRFIGISYDYDEFRNIV